ncbi:CIC11C00000001030 [Sungouiella intermedia]|uniref:CIC11C00000001030 n=1 Tax=Sungouiella intermedia TaxID=45354 RepID=A0A1L0DE51_9ASCO|nr:CIC11C00000001030 [[Candida] intermedia]
MRIACLFAVTVCLGIHNNYSHRLQRLLEQDLSRPEEYSAEGHYFLRVLKIHKVFQSAFDHYGDPAEAVELMKLAKKRKAYGDYMFLWNYLKFTSGSEGGDLDLMSELAVMVTLLSPSFLPTLLNSTSNAKLKQYYRAVVNMIVEQDNRNGYGAGNDHDEEVSGIEHQLFFQEDWNWHYVASKNCLSKEEAVLIKLHEHSRIEQA